MNAVKQEKARKSKDCGCQNSNRVDTDGALHTPVSQPQIDEKYPECACNGAK